MKKFPSIKKNKDFQTVYKKGKSYGNKTLVMYIYKTEGISNRLGISVSKKVGNSCVRHKMARKIREIFRLNQNQIKSSYDIIVIARVKSDQLDYTSLNQAYLHLCSLHKILK